MANPFKSIRWVTSGDGERRARFVWRSKSYAAFVTVEQIKELVRELILLLQSEETYFASERTGETGETATKGSSKNPGQESRRKHSSTRNRRPTRRKG